jgi:threonine dehydrogenase-like Zn-dependent dehydrogenase
MGPTMLRPGGRYVQVGFSHQAAPLNAGRLMFREIEILGSLGCRPVDYPRIIEMIRLKRIQLEPVITHRFKLDDINKAFDLMRKGDSLRSIIVM